MGNPQGNNGGRFYSYLNRPVLVDCSFIVNNADTKGLGITGLTGSGVKNVFMHTTQTPGTNRGYLNPNPAAGYALIQLDNNYNRFRGSFRAAVAPNSGSALAINATALTAHNPYIITSVGVGPAGAATIAPVADVSGSLASTWFQLFDSYGNVFIIWFQVGGVGTAPQGVSGILTPVQIASGATAAQIGTALVTIIENLPSAPGSSVMSFTASGTTTVTVTSTVSRPLAGVPADGSLAPTGFTFAQTVFNTNDACWRGVGLPNGIRAAVGASFIATATGFSSGGGSTGTVEVPGLTDIGSVEIVGDPNQTLAPAPLGPTPNVGGFILVQFLAPTSSSTTTPLATAPTALSQVYMTFLVDNGDGK